MPCPGARDRFALPSFSYSNVTNPDTLLFACRLFAYHQQARLHLCSAPRLPSPPAASSFSNRRQDDEGPGSQVQDAPNQAPGHVDHSGADGPQRAAVLWHQGLFFASLFSLVDGLVHSFTQASLSTVMRSAVIDCLQQLFKVANAVNYTSAIA